MRQSMVITEWQDEAREEGRREAQRTDLRRVLQTRFFVPVPDDLAAAIETVADSEELARWLDIALTAVSLDAFRAAIQR